MERNISHQIKMIKGIPIGNRGQKGRKIKNLMVRPLIFQQTKWLTPRHKKHNRHQLE